MYTCNFCTRAQSLWFSAMPPNKSKGRICNPVDGVCDLSRDGAGDPIKKNAACATCGEWRCKTHCGCGRNGSATGRSAARPGATGAPMAQAVPKAQPKAIPQVAAKAGPQQPVLQAQAAPALVAPALLAPACSSFQVFNESTWLEQCLAELERASAAKIASMLFDEPSLTAALLKLLRGPAPFTCHIVVDLMQFRNGGCPRQRGTLLELQAAGAFVRLASGHSGVEVFGPGARGGIMHMKAVVLGSGVCYAGSANLTKAARTNRELVFRLAGPSASPVQRAIEDAFRSGEELTVDS
jgi:hypothetical protein